MNAEINNLKMKKILPSIREHLTQKEIALKLGVSVRTVRRWELSENLPPQYLLPALEDLHKKCIESKQDNKDIKTYTFIDLFAGAGGISEGFLQASYNGKKFEFLCASDINENCELTHLVRYNYQLGLDTKFLRSDITDPDFINNLQDLIGEQEIDVVCGGPPCQSFSLAGKRSKNDRKDDLFSHYLEVIKELHPKYFVMENVKGILTKNNGQIAEQILESIRTIIDADKAPKLTTFINETFETYKKEIKEIDLLPYYIEKIKLETSCKSATNSYIENYVLLLENLFKKFTASELDYKTSKSDYHINTIRHGLHLLKRSSKLELIQKQIIIEKDLAYIGNDEFEHRFNEFIDTLDQDSIITTISSAFIDFFQNKKKPALVTEFLEALQIFSYSFSDCINKLADIFKPIGQLESFEKVMNELYLYKISKPLVVNAVNYGVPQNRERVLFIGCRSDQKLISEVPEIIHSDHVNVFEALHDLDFLSNGETGTKYDSNLTRMHNELPVRTEQGEISGKDKNKTYAEWSRTGRLPDTYNVKTPIYVRTLNDFYENKFEKHQLHNHQVSLHNSRVKNRLKIIQKHKSYEASKEELIKKDLESGKRNYNLLSPNLPSPTILTIPDDYIHYNYPRSLSVREMARLQSFDDSFVFQGKRSTGGTKRKEEIPQYSLVGNAVPPLLARAIAQQLLRNIN